MCQNIFILIKWSLRWGRIQFSRGKGREGGGVIKGQEVLMMCLSRITGTSEQSYLTLSNDYFNSPRFLHWGGENNKFEYCVHPVSSQRTIIMYSNWDRIQLLNEPQRAINQNHILMSSETSMGFKKRIDEECYGFWKTIKTLELRCLWSQGN